jgi:LmbE family N-acetylglucosaminyl deacetylase
VAGDEVSVFIVHRCGRPDATSDVDMLDAQHRLGIPYRTGWAEGSYTVEGVVSSLEPDIVYTHSSADLHADHREVHERVLVATRPDSGVWAVYAFETPSATDWGVRPFIPQRFVDIGDHLDAKLHAMAAYESELRTYPHPRNLNSLTVRSQFWGQRVGVVHAEAFEVIRECW